jgi:surface polysaccharide O-acyltransferase-like enzyme
MPLFFIISGAAAAIGFRPEKLSEKGAKALFPIKFYWKKFLRLGIPLIIGTILFVIPCSYIGREYRAIEINRGDYSETKGFFEFLQKYARDEFPYYYGWLWFLLALLLCYIMDYPFFKMYQIIRRDGKLVYSHIKELLFW